VRSGGNWRLRPDAEREILLPWLDREPDVIVRLAVLLFIEGLLLDPERPYLEDEDTGIFAIKAVPGTRVGLMWVLDRPDREIVLALIG